MGRRRLTPEERALWSTVAATTRPLAPEPAAKSPVEPAVKPAVKPVAKTAPEPVGKPASPPRPPEAQAPARTAPGVAFDPAPSWLDDLSPAAGLDGRTARRLKQGRTEPQARLDLHGMTAERAHRALTRFLHQSAADGLRCVLVVTGKGAPKRLGEYGGAPAQGVLRSSVPRWLRTAALAHLVVGVYEAHPRHGGGGALYVYLKRRR